MSIYAIGEICGLLFLTIGKANIMPNSIARTLAFSIRDFREDFREWVQFLCIIFCFSIGDYALLATLKCG